MTSIQKKCPPPPAPPAPAPAPAPAPVPRPPKIPDNPDNHEPRKDGSHSDLHDLHDLQFMNSKVIELQHMLHIFDKPCNATVVQAFLQKFGYTISVDDIEDHFHHGIFTRISFYAV